MDQVDEVKQKTDIIPIIGERVELKKAGRNYKALCPFHSEKTPSFMVSPELQIFKCFGCGEAGDAFAFLEKHEGMDFPEALKYLAERAGVKLAPFKSGAKGEKERLYDINSFTTRFYHHMLLKHPLGKGTLSYLREERGLKLGTIEEFQLGYSPENPLIIKKFLLDKKKFHPKDIEKAGIGYLRGGSLMDKLRGRIIFPLFDHRGNAVGFAGRTLPSVKDQHIAKYINSPETPVYHKGSVLYGLNLSRSFIKKKGVAIVTEGELDAISSWQIGIKNVVAIKGSALTEDQVRLLGRFSKKLILAMDADFAGDTAARKGIDVAEKEGLELKVAKLKKFKDPDEAARLDPEGYKKTLIKAVGVWDFIFDLIFSKHGTTGADKAKISREVTPVLASISDKIVQAHYIEQVARRLSVPVEAVSQQVSETKSLDEQKPKVALTSLPEKKSRREILEERLLSLTFQSDPKILLEASSKPLIKTPLAKRIVDEFAAFTKENREFNPSEFSEKLPKELFNGFAELVLKDTQGLTEDKKLLEKELLMVKRELAILETKEQMELCGIKIKEYEQKKQKNKLTKAEEAFNKLVAKLARLEDKEDKGIILHEG